MKSQQTKSKWGNKQYSKIHRLETDLNFWVIQKDY